MSQAQLREQRLEAFGREHDPEARERRCDVVGDRLPRARRVLRRLGPSELANILDPITLGRHAVDDAAP
jgi:hypothetical protein